MGAVTQFPFWKPIPQFYIYWTERDPSTTTCAPKFATVGRSRVWGIRHDSSHGDLQALALSGLGGTQNIL